eukprot:11678768-Alexandrium_andersonii.AAC.1
MIGWPGSEKSLAQRTLKKDPQRQTICLSARTKGASMRAGSRLDTVTSPSGAPGQSEAKGLSASTGFHFWRPGSSEG